MTSISGKQYKHANSYVRSGVVETRKVAGIIDGLASKFNSNLARRRCIVRQGTGYIDIDYGTVNGMGILKDALASLLEESTITDNGAYLRLTSTGGELDKLQLVPDGTNSVMNTAECDRNLMLYRCSFPAKLQDSLAGVLSYWAGRRQGPSQFETMAPAQATHDVTMGSAVGALRVGYQQSRGLLSPEVRTAGSSLADANEGSYDVGTSFDNGTSLWPTVLTRPLSETSFGNIDGRRDKEYQASWTYVPVVFRGEGLAALEPMGIDVLKRNMTWYTEAEPYREAVFAWMPIWQYRDSVSRIAVENSAIPCQNTWTLMGSRAHERLRAYDLLPNRGKDFSKPPQIEPQVGAEPEGAPGETDDDFAELLPDFIGCPKLLQFVSELSETDSASYTYRSSQITDAWPTVEDEYAWKQSADQDSLVRAWADNAYGSLRVVVNQPTVFLELFGYAKPVASSAELSCIAPEYPVLWPFGAQSKVTGGPRRVHETRIDAVFHLSVPGSNGGTVLLVEYKMHMELASRFVSSPGAFGREPVAALRWNRTKHDSAAALNMFNTVAGKQTSQQRQAETNAWLLYVNTGLLPTHCVILHASRRQPGPGTDSYRYGSKVPRASHATVLDVPCSFSAIRRLDMREKFMRSLLNVMLCSMYRGTRTANSRANTTAYCDRFYVVPNIDKVTARTAIKDDSQLQQLNDALPGSVLPTAYGLASFASDKRWGKTRASSLCGDGHEMPEWIRQVKFGQARQGQLPVFAESTSVATGASELTNIATAPGTDRKDATYILLCQSAFDARIGIKTNVVLSGTTVLAFCKFPGKLQRVVPGLSPSASVLQIGRARSTGNSYLSTEPAENTRMRTKLNSDVRQMAELMQTYLVHLPSTNHMDVNTLYAYMVLAAHLVIQHDTVPTFDADTLIAFPLHVVRSIAKRVDFQGRSVSQVYTDNGDTVDFTAIGSFYGSPLDRVVTLLARTLQRVLNSRLIHTLACARNSSHRDLLACVPRISSSVANPAPLTFDEFIHSSDRGTLSSDMMRVACDLSADGMSETLRSAGQDLLLGIGILVTNAFEQEQFE
jgi:hypothetical protein